MAFDPVLRTDLLDKELATIQDKVKILSEAWIGQIINKATAFEPTKSPLPSKNIVEVMDLIKEAIEDYQVRTHVNEDAKVKFLYSYPDVESQLEAISVSHPVREPGMFAQGGPFENKTKQLKPLLREYGEDADNPGYKRAVLGFWYDNVLRLTCWARTNKVANERALWLENVMEEYAWFFGYSGVNRLLYQGRQKEEKIVINGNKVYGRPIDYFVRTEKLRSISQKELEQVCIRLIAGKI